MIPLLEALMRGYPGIMSYSMPIDEEDLARKCDVGVPMLHQLLYKLSLERILNYIPADRRSLVYLCHDRLTPGNIDLKPERYKFLKDNAEARLEAVRGFLLDYTVCRSRQLLRYFGETNTCDCGQCDVCLSHNGNMVTKDHLATARESILKLLGDGKGHHVTDVLSIPHPTDDIDAALKQMMTEEEIIFDEGFLRLNAGN